MKQKIKIAILLVSVISFMSCSRYIVPPFTDVSKIAQIKTGMKVKQVSDILGIDPYDVYYQQETGAQILSFNYRLKNRVMYIYNTVNVAEVQRQTSDENSQKAGELYYEKNYRTLFALFDNKGDMTSYITTAGRSDQGKLIVIGNTLKYYDDKNTTLVDSLYNKATNPFYGNQPYRIMIDKHGNFVPDQQEAPKRRGLFGRKY